MDNRLRYLTLLRCFDAAARHQSYKLAATELSISQAAVSQQVRKLEQHLATKLFVRDGRVMLLTDQGQTLHSYVSQAFDLVLTGFDQIQVEPEDGVLIVSTTISFASIWLVPRLWKFADLYPGIKVNVMVSAELEDVRRSGIDIAIRQGESNAPEVVQEVLFTDPVFPVCSPKLVTDTKLNSPEKINRCQLVEVESPGKHSWENWCAVAGVKFHPESLSSVDVMSWEMGINSVVIGQGLCLASLITTKDYIKKGVLVRPFEAEIKPGLRFSFLYDPDSPRLARIKLFRAWLNDELEHYFGD